MRNGRGGKQALDGWSDERRRTCGQAKLVARLATIAEHDCRDRLGKIGAPVLVIYGADDPVDPLERADALAQALPLAKRSSLGSAIWCWTSRRRRTIRPERDNVRRFPRWTSPG